MQDMLKRFREWYRKLPEKKHYVEFVTAVLSVPVMLTVIIVNLNNLAQQKNANQKQKETSPAPIQVIITGDKQKDLPIPTDSTQRFSTPTSATCIKEVGPVSIVSPRENEIVFNDPVCITLSTASNYCSIQWSYRLNNGDWSDFTDKNICLHNLTNGDKVFQLNIKSTSSGDTVMLQRSFIYAGNSEPSVTPPVATSSASL